MFSCISNIAWRKEETTAIIDLLLKNSIKHLEIAPATLFSLPIKPSYKEVSKTRRFWNDKGIELYAMQGLLFKQDHYNIFGSSENRIKMIKYICKIIKIAEDLGVRIIVFGSPKNRKKGRLLSSKANETGKDFFLEICNAAQKANIVICLEPNAKEYNCDYINNNFEAINLIRLVNHNYFKLNFDTSTILMNSEDLYQEIIQYKEFIKHFHISNPYLQQDNDPKLNYSKISEVLNSISYSGAVSIEMVKLEHGQNINSVNEKINILNQYFAQ